jgi:hypothetical protein
VTQGSDGHQRTDGGGASGSTLPPGFGVTMVAPAAPPAATARSIGSVQPCGAS